MTKIIHTEKAPAAIGPYVQAVDLGNLVLTSGQIPVCLLYTSNIFTDSAKAVCLS